jgi:signal transduction histidine kinase
MIRRRLGLRLRIALLIGGMVLVAGGAVLALTYVSLSAVLADPPVFGLGTAQSPQPPVAPTSAPLPSPSSAISPSSPSGEPVAEREAMKRQLSAEFQRLRSDFRDQVLPSLVRRGAVLLAVLGAIGLWIGWLISGYAVRPMRRITTTARRIASRNVRGRINWGGPHDEARELADMFDDMLARLEEAVDDQWRFVANASHELKTPLAINRTLLEVAMGRPDAPPQIGQLGETLLEVNARHEGMIDGLLTLARSEHAVARPVPVDLADIVEHVAEIARPEAQRAGVELRIDAGSAPMEGDPALLERLVLNLVQNAIRYNATDGWVRVTSERQGSSVRLRVANSGPEILAHDVAGLFEPFRRLHDRVGSSRGTGLGLSIVRSVARAHGGDVVATPRRGGGLDVEVTLRPRARPEGDDG